jgi:hypothetical protein
VKISARSRRSRILTGGVLFLALGLLLSKPLLIAYHRMEMATIWQAHTRVWKPSGPIASLRKLFNLPAGHRPDPEAAARAFSHRQALVDLGYFTRHRFAIQPVTVGTPEYEKLCESVAASNRQHPIAQFDYDQSQAPQRVCGLIVYATKHEMPLWEHFIANFAEHPK